MDTLYNIIKKVVTTCLTFKITPSNEIRARNMKIEAAIYYKL